MVSMVPSGGRLAGPGGLHCAHQPGPLSRSRVIRTLHMPTATTVQVAIVDDGIRAERTPRPPVLPAGPCPSREPSAGKILTGDRTHTPRPDISR